MTLPVFPNQVSRDAEEPGLAFPVITRKASALGSFVARLLHEVVGQPQIASDSNPNEAVERVRTAEKRSSQPITRFVMTSECRAKTIRRNQRKSVQLASFPRQFRSAAYNMPDFASPPRDNYRFLQFRRRSDET